MWSSNCSSSYIALREKNGFSKEVLCPASHRSEKQRSVPKARGVLRGVIPIEDLEKTIFPTPIVQEIHKGDLVEIVSGPFKNEKAKVVRFDKNKNEVTIELIEAAVPIPVTVSGRDLKILKSEESE